MNRQVFAKILLRMRYSKPGQAINTLLKARLGGLWLSLRDLAITGHEPSRDEYRRASVIDFLKRNARFKRSLPANDREKWVEVFTILLRKRS